MAVHEVVILHEGRILGKPLRNVRMAAQKFSEVTAIRVSVEGEVVVAAITVHILVMVIPSFFLRKDVRILS